MCGATLCRGYASVGGLRRPLPSEHQDNDMLRTTTEIPWLHSDQWPFAYM